MHYQSTRDKKINISAAEAIALGLSRDGGLFVPASIPKLPAGAIDELCALNYRERAAAIMKLFLDDYTAEELAQMTASAYSTPKYDSLDTAPVRKLENGTHFLELWHGPTCAFKDMALQMLPHLLTAALKKNGETREVCILVATSGDTGKAALEGFCDVSGTKILVFYPKDGVSAVQKLQMTSQSGDNVGVCSVVGNFDDAQTGVKEIFSDEELREKLSERGYFLSSANSINWGRLLPQIVYYISAYCDLVSSGDISKGDSINFCVPTGNFGDILAGYYAKEMGLPVHKLLCASNKNDVLTEFFTTGCYDKNREFYTTISPSMDILLSSNLERLLYDVSGKDDAMIRGFMKELSDKGKYCIPVAMKTILDGIIESGCCDDDSTQAAIGSVFKEHGYLMDTHTAVAYRVLCDYREKTGDYRESVVVSTASPFKFCEAVLAALGEKGEAYGLELIEKLEAVSGETSPVPLAALKTKTERFTQSIEKNAMTSVVLDFLK